MSDAINAGLPVSEIDAEADVTKSFDRLAAELAGIEAPITEDTSTATEGFFDKLLRPRPLTVGRPWRTQGIARTNHPTT